jgi:hypothetical protein
VRQCLRFLDTVAHIWQVLALRHHQHRTGIENMAEDKLGIALQGSCQGDRWITEIALKLTKSTLIVIERLGHTGRHGCAASILLYFTTGYHDYSPVQVFV